MKVTRLGAGLAALTLLVAGCSGGSGDKQEIGNAEGEVSAEGETLTLWIMEGTNPEAEPFFDELSTAFEDETGAELDVQFVPWADAHDKFVKSIAGGNDAGRGRGGHHLDARVRRRRRARRPDRRGQRGGARRRPRAGAGRGGHRRRRALRHAVVRRRPVGRLPHRRLREGRHRAADDLGRAGRGRRGAEEGRARHDPVPDRRRQRVRRLPVHLGRRRRRRAVQDGDAWTATIDSAEAQEGIEFYTGLATEHGLSSPAATTWDEADLSDAFTRGDVGDDDRRQLDAGRARRGPTPTSRARSARSRSRARTAASRRPSSVVRTCRSSTRTENADLAWALVRADDHRRVRRRSGASSPASSRAPTRCSRRSSSRRRPAGRAVRPAGGRGGQVRAGDAALRPDPGQEDGLGDAAVDPVRRRVRGRGQQGGRRARWTRSSRAATEVG